MTAYYDPAHPDHAYLERTVSVLPWALAGGAAFWLLISFVLARSAYRGLRRPHGR